jgi:prepilin-type N-terminal cleavage/methylation domain-containing protein
MIKILNPKQKGFTLLEITVVVSIIILLSTIFIANYRGGEKQFALQRSAHKLVQDLRRAQEMAMSSQRTSSEFGSETVPQGGYGISFKKDLNSYILFADCDGDGKFDETGEALSCQKATKVTPFPEKIKELSLEEGIKITKLLPSLENSLSITFLPPDPKVIITPSGSSASITLTFNSQSKKVIIINTVGLIDIE